MTAAAASQKQHDAHSKGVVSHSCSLGGALEGRRKATRCFHDNCLLQLLLLLLVVALSNQHPAASTVNANAGSQSRLDGLNDVHTECCSMRGTLWRRWSMRL
jgi:hypothetical protein